MKASSCAYSLLRVVRYAMVWALRTTIMSFGRCVSLPAKFDARTWTTLFEDTAAFSLATKEEIYLFRFGDFFTYITPAPTQVTTTAASGIAGISLCLAIWIDKKSPSVIRCSSIASFHACLSTTAWTSWMYSLLLSQRQCDRFRLYRHESSLHSQDIPSAPIPERCSQTK